MERENRRPKKMPARYRTLYGSILMVEMTQKRVFKKKQQNVPEILYRSNVEENSPSPPVELLQTLYTKRPWLLGPPKLGTINYATMALPIPVLGCRAR